MAGPVRIAVVGATGLVGSKILEQAVGREDLRLVALARREVALPPGSRMEVFVSHPDAWSEVLDAVRPDAVICALGTTWKKSGKDENAFRAVDQKLVLDCARAGHEAAVERFVAVSSIGADRASGNFYLRVKGEAEVSLAKIGFRRLDILRPGLLRGARSGDRRLGERIAIAAGPLVNVLLHGRLRRYRSISAERVAGAALALAQRTTQGRYVHDNDAILRAARIPGGLAAAGGRAD